MVNFMKKYSILRKQILRSLVGVILCMLLLLLVSAEEAPVLSVQGKEASAGQTVDVSVSLEGTGYIAYQMDLCYDASVLEPVSVAGGAGGALTSKTESGRIKLAYAGAVETEGGILFVVQFLVKTDIGAGESTPLRLENARVFGADGKDLEFTLQNGAIVTPGVSNSTAPSDPDTSSAGTPSVPDVSSVGTSSAPSDDPSSGTASSSSDDTSLGAASSRPDDASSETGSSQSEDSSSEATAVSPESDPSESSPAAGQSSLSPSSANSNGDDAPKSPASVGDSDAEHPWSIPVLAAVGTGIVIAAVLLLLLLLRRRNGKRVR